MDRRSQSKSGTMTLNDRKNLRLRSSGSLSRWKARLMKAREGQIRMTPTKGGQRTFPNSKSRPVGHPFQGISRKTRGITGREKPKGIDATRRRLRQPKPWMSAERERRDTNRPKSHCCGSDRKGWVFPRNQPAGQLQDDAVNIIWRFLQAV